MLIVPEGGPKTKPKAVTTVSIVAITNSSTVVKPPERRGKEFVLGVVLGIIQWSKSVSIMGPRRLTRIAS